ncbi:DUF1490 family protein [Saccharopolyspora rosea]|uniref:DUF1490 family protein n=1 Tax=Saccharopolyspora rosea TaxID=524884 RepID=A0ABW3FUD6_9PSEU|nr:DUF1490 family protein [Saccharopolyspora rosea]
MVLGAVVGRVAGVVGTGLAGAVAYDGIKRFVRSGGARRGAVAVTAWGLRGIRAAETGTEQARLTLADVVSEARERIGEQTPPPGTTEHGHEH